MAAIVHVSSAVQRIYKRIRAVAGEFVPYERLAHALPFADIQPDLY
jgi:hypothetical protein